MGDVKHYHKNPRQITKQQLADLSHDLKALGDLSGITHDLDTDEILTGNQRCEALPGIMSGLIQPEIIQHFDPPTEDGTALVGYFLIDGRMYNYRAVKGWNDKKREWANVAANKRGGSWDFDILANSFEVPDLLAWGFDEKELAGFDFGEESKDAEPQISRADELQEIWKVQTGDLWQIGNHRLICGDCTDPAVVEWVMGGEKAYLNFSDPPYGIKRDKGFEGFGGFGPPIARRRYSDEWDENRPTEEQFYFMLSHSDYSVFWGGNYFADILPKSTHWIVWDKNNTMPTYGDCELAWTSFERKSVKKYTVTYNGLIGKEKERFHPTQKPLTLYVACLKDYTEDSEIIIDFYLGTGTTLVACENLGRRGRGIEISPAYCAVTLQRMSDAFPGIEIKRID